MISRHQSANLHRNITESLFSDGAAVSSQATENAVHHHAALGCCGANAPVSSTLYAVAAAMTARLVCSVIKNTAFRHLVSPVCPEGGLIIPFQSGKCPQSGGTAFSPRS